MRKRRFIVRKKGSALLRICLILGILLSLIHIFKNLGITEVTAHMYEQTDARFKVEVLPLG